MNTVTCLQLLMSLWDVLQWYNALSIPKDPQPVALQAAINSEVEKMLQQDVIQPSSSPWSSPVIMVKKDGSQFCIDYRKLNLATHRDTHE